MDNSKRIIKDEDLHVWLEKDKVYTLSEYKNTLNKYKICLPSTSFDCHGLTLNDAHSRVNDFIDRHYFDYETNQNLIAITGKSGEMNREFSDWMNKNPLVKSFYKNKNNGSWTLRIKKKHNQK